MRTTGEGTWLRAAVLVALLALGTVLALTLDLPAVHELRAWVDAAGPAGWTGMALGVALVLLAPVPRSAVSVLVGVVAGFGTGVAVALAGGLLAALAAFGLSRTLGRSAAIRLVGAGLDRIDGLMVRRGFAAVLVGRLLPVMPFVVLSYGAGLTAIRWPAYVAGNVVGLVPSTVIQVGIGASAGTLVAGAAQPVVLSLVAAAVVVSLIAAGTWHRRRGSATA